MKMHCQPAGPGALLPPLSFPPNETWPTGAPALPSASAPSDDRPLGCGWFDSSHELGAGLQLTVHDEPTELALLVPLNWWLQWELDECLRSVRMAPTAAAQPAARSR